MGQEDIEKLDGELDSLSFRMLELMKDFIDVKVTLEDLIKTGSLHLAKSRYIMGNKSVSASQLPHGDRQINATVKVLKKDEDELVYELNKLDLKKEKSDLKQRKKGDDEDGSEEVVKNEDPIKWFGLLSPQNLKQAQSVFGKALEYSVQCVNLQIEMNQVEQKYKEILKLKAQSQKVSEDK